MTFTFEELKSLRDEGYTDDQIVSVLAEDDSSINDIFKEGYTLEQITSTISGQPVPEGFAARPVEPERPAGTSFSKEVSQLGPAFIESIGRPLENMGEGFEVVGFQGVANALKGAITEPENYVSAAERFMEPQPGESQFLGFAWQYAPRAAVEQVGQAIGAIGTRAVGAAAGGAVAGPPGAIAGGFVGPAIFGAAQVIGPVAKERARNNGREVPTNQDLAAATLTAIGSGALDAIGARYLPGGDKATGKFFKRVASSFVGEGLLTEAPQSVIEQVGSTAGTEAGLNINAKQALGEGIIGGTTAFGLQAITYPLTKEPKKQVIRTPEQAEEIDIQAKSNEEAVSLMGQPADQDKNELISRVNEIEKVVANNETLINALEPNDETRTQLELENKIAKQEAGRLRGELEKSVGLAPIPTAEQQQVELAKQIAAPVEPAPAKAPAAPVSETITPAVKAAPVTPAPAEAPAVTPASAEEVAIPASDKKEWVIKATEEGLVPDKITFQELKDEAFNYGAMDGDWLGNLEPQGNKGDLPARQDIEDVFGRKFTDEEFTIIQQEYVNGVNEMEATPAPQPIAPSPTPPPTPAEAVTPAPAETQIVVRRGEAGTDTSITLEDKAYRGMTEDEFNNTILKTGDVESRGDFRFAEEGTNFAEKFEDAESYVNFGRDDPRKTNKPTFIVEVDKQLLNKNRRGDYEASGPIAPVRIWKITPRDGELVATEINLPRPTAAEPAGIAIGNRVKTKTTPQSFVVEEVLPQSEREAELGEQYYRIKNERTGEVQTVEVNDIKPIKISTATKKMAPVRVEEKVQPVPEADRYTFDEAGIRSIEFFGGKAPDGLLIVNDTVNPNYKMKAGYDSETGEIIVNRAYIKKGESIEDILTHELGHYIFSDPKFQADFKNFLESMPDDTRAEIEAIINESYNEETGQTQIEERQVMAFTALVKANKDTLSKWETIKNTIKRWINKIFGTNIKLSDEGAMAVFNVGYKRFNSGERIIREMKKGTLRTAPEGMTQMDRDYLAAVERGDMETAQRMVDEAARAAGYDSPKVYHGSTSDIEIFDTNKIPTGDTQGSYFTDSKSYAATRGEPKSFFLKIENPASNEIEFEAGLLAENQTEKPKRGETYRADDGRLYLTRKKTGDFVRNKLESQGYDGVVREIAGATTYIAFNPTQIKSADPVTYDDAGNVIPLSQRFRATSPDIRRMAPEPRKPAAEAKPTMKRYDKKSQVAGVPGIGAAIDTPKGINARTEKTIQDRVFNSDIVNDNQTKKAWNLIQNLESTNPNAGKNAEAINQLTRETMQDVDADEVVKQTIGAVKLRNELFKYAMKLTAQGDKKMLDYLLNIRLAFGGGTIVEGDPGRLLQAHQSLKNWIVRASEAERQGFFESAAQQFFDTKTPTDEQIQQIKDIFNKVNDVKIDQEKELMTELEDVGKAAGVDLPAAVDKQLNSAPGLDPMVVAITNMLKMGGTFIYKKFPSKVEQAVKNTINRGITNYRKKLVSKGANGLETGFWKTLATTEEKPGPLGELDAAQNRALGNIVKSTLVSLGLKGTPTDTKMSIYEQVASILGEQPLGKDKMNLADEKIRGGIEAGRNAELENATEDQADAINSKWDAIQFAWDESMSRSLDMPVSDTMLRRLIANEIKDEKTSIQELATLMDEEPAIGTSRQDRLVNSIIEKVSGITFDGQPTRDYTALKKYLSDMLENIVQARQQKNAAAKSVAKVKRDASGDPDKQAQAQIDKLAKIQADPTIFGEKKIDPVRNAVRDALSLKLNIGFTPEQAADIKRNWKGAYVADPNKKGIPTSFMLEMQRLGVSEAAADTLSEIVWKQIEVNAMNRQMEATTKAVEAGPIGGMVQAILDTPLANQQDPDWRKQVILDYLKNAGIRPAQAENIAKLFDLSLRKRFAKAQEEAAIKAAKSIKGGLNPVSKRALDKFLKAIRAQVLDPGTDVAKAFGEQMGWTGFTAEQITKLNELDAIVNDTNKTDAEIAVAIEQINKIIDKVSAPPQVKDIIASYYVGNILGRITTFTIQALDPLAFTTFNAAVESFRNITNPQQLMSVWSNYGRGISNLIRETAFSFKNDVLRSGKIVDYMARQDRQIGRLWDEAERKWKAGDIKGAMKDGIFGYTAWTFRTLKALDDGAYSLLTTTTLPSYVDAALKRAKVPAEKRRGVMRGILEARELDIKNMVEQGTPRNDAIVYANEKMRGEVTKVLTGMNIDAQEVIDASINDALSRIGKTRFKEDIHGKETEIKDLGFISSPLLRFYESVARSVNEKGGSEAQKIFYRILLGFPLIPARIFNIAAGYTPLTIYRHFLKNRYSLTYGTALQRRQRIIEQMAGTAVLLPLLLLRSNSLDEEDEKEKGFGVYITGQGPSRTMDRETRAQWDKKFDPYSIVFRVGNKSASIDARAAGPLSVMIYTLGAIDDWENRRKQEGLKTSKDDWRDVHEKASLFTAMYELAGSFLLTTARRGPTTGVIQGLIDFKSYPDDPIAAISKEVAFSGMPAVPILGTGIVKNLSDLFSQPIDNKTKEGAILSNIPIVGPVAGQPALNAYGQRIGELRVSEKLKKSFGLPFTLITSDTEDDTKITSLTLKFGNGPTPIRRDEVENALKDVISDEEWYLAAKTFGNRNKEKVLAAYNRYDKMKPDRFNDAMNRLTTDSKNAAIRAVKQQRRNRP